MRRWMHPLLSQSSIHLGGSLPLPLPLLLLLLLLVLLVVVAVANQRQFWIKY